MKVLLPSTPLLRTVPALYTFRHTSRPPLPSTLSHSRDRGGRGRSRIGGQRRSYADRRTIKQQIYFLDIATSTYPHPTVCRHPLTHPTTLLRRCSLCVYCSYLSSKHKIIARQPWMHCQELEVLTSKQRLDNVAGRPNSPIDKLNADTPVPPGLTALNPFHPSFTLVLTWAVPLKDSDGVYVVIYLRHNKANLAYMTDPKSTIAARKHGAPIDEKKVSVNQAGEYTDPALETAARSAFLIALDRFVKSSNEYRDAHLKFIPRLVEGNYIVKKAVGSKPALIGTKLKQTYHVNVAKNYMEVDVDVCSSKIAANIFSLVKKAARELTIDFNFTIEGQDLDTLPEVLIGGGRIIHIDTKGAARP